MIAADAAGAKTRRGEFGVGLSSLKLGPEVRIRLPPAKSRPNFKANGHLLDSSAEAS